MSKGGILIPATAKSVDKKGVWGETIGVGPHVRNVQPQDEVLYLPEDAIEVGDTVRFAKPISEADVEAFAEATGDHQWIHVDPERVRDGFEGRVAGLDVGGGLRRPDPPRTRHLDVERPHGGPHRRRPARDAAGRRRCRV